MRTVRTNRDFGPAFVVVDKGREIASAHSREDADAFARGDIDAAELEARNIQFEERDRILTREQEAERSREYTARITGKL